MRLLKQAAIFAALFLFVFSASRAFAQAGADAIDTSVEVPWGDWLGQTLSYAAMIAVTGVGTILAWALRFLPATLRAYVTQQLIKQVEQLLQRAIQHAVNTVAEQLRGRELSVDVKNQIVAGALQYAL